MRQSLQPRYSCRVTAYFVDQPGRNQGAVVATVNPVVTLGRRLGAASGRFPRTTVPELHGRSFSPISGK